ncbi:MAG: hypothetical protein ACFFBH_12170 [Promethearchaeota archaeon]
MELIEESAQNNEKETLIIPIKCPVCKLERELKFPKSVINQAKNLTTISIPKDLICEHHFQAFVDKNFMIRGYQKVDFEYAYDLVKSKKSLSKGGTGKEFYEYIVIEENYLAYKPKENQIIIEKAKIKDQFESEVKCLDKKYKMNQEDIYNEFWDFIDDTNKDFQDFIKNDGRRNKLEKLY